MKRRSFLKNSALLAGTLSISAPSLANSSREVTSKSYIEWRVYQISRSSNSRNRLNQYFTEALKPFLIKRNVKFAMFSEYSKEEPVKLYVMLAYPDIAAYINCMKEMLTDPEFIESSKNYQSIPASQAVFNRYETYLLEAFDNFPQVKMQDESKGLYELRLYESATDDAGKRKIAMFNNEEIALFVKTGINPIFFGRIIAGQCMPALLYLVAFTDMTERDASWSKFSQDPEWATMRDKPEYADTVSNIRRIFLIPEIV